MKNTAAFTLLWFFVCGGAVQAQRFATNNISQAQASRVASQLWTNMPEESVAFMIESRQGFVQALRVGTSGQWDRSYLLNDGSFLNLRFEPEGMIRVDGRWEDGLLRAASISSNGTKDVLITLTNAPQPLRGADGSQPSGSLTNRTSGTASSRGSR